MRTAIPGTCRSRTRLAGTPTATRLRVDPALSCFAIAFKACTARTSPRAVGDFILKRRDQIFAYVLAVVVDDAAQGVTHSCAAPILLDNTPRQIYLQRLLGLPQPSYAHVPVLTEPDDSKLAKSRAQRAARRGRPPLPQLLSIFSLLGLAPPDSLRAAQVAEAWRWAIGQWDIGGIPKRLNLRVSD